MGFFDDPRSRRLKKDYAEMLKLQDESDVLAFKAKGDLPEHYDLTFKGRVLAGTNPISFTNTNHAEIDLRGEYPRALPAIRWTSPIAHPNVSGSNVCFGNFHMSPYVKLTEICEILWDIARLALFNPHGGYRTSEDWYAVMKKIPGGVPTDPRILRNKAAAPPPRAEPEPEGDMLIIEGSRPRMGAAFSRADVQDLIGWVEEYLFENHMDRDTHVMSTEEWTGRGEKYGEGSIITIATEGPIGRLLNGYDDGHGLDYQAKLGRWNDFLASMGLWWDLGYAWSIHLYPMGAGPWMPTKRYGGVKSWRPR